MALAGRRVVGRGGRRERVRFAGSGPEEIAWVEGSDDDGDLRVADIGR